MTNERGSWGSRPGFILAATGSAVGLGNIWGFPTQVGQGGGAAFVLVYLISVVFICAPILLAEILLGRHSQLGPAGAVRRIAPRGVWWVIGALAVAAGTFILSFYAVIAGWTAQYLWLSIRGRTRRRCRRIGRPLHRPRRERPAQHRLHRPLHRRHRLVREPGHPPGDRGRFAPDDAAAVRAAGGPRHPLGDPSRRGGRARVLPASRPFAGPGSQCPRSGGRAGVLLAEPRHGRPHHLRQLPAPFASGAVGLHGDRRH